MGEQFYHKLTRWLRFRPLVKLYTHTHTDECAVNWDIYTTSSGHLCDICFQLFVCLVRVPLTVAQRSAKLCTNIPGTSECHLVSQGWRDLTLHSWRSDAALVHSCLLLPVQTLYTTNTHIGFYHTMLMHKYSYKNKTNGPFYLHNHGFLWLFNWSLRWITLFLRHLKKFYCQNQKYTTKSKYISLKSEINDNKNNRRVLFIIL